MGFNKIQKEEIGQKGIWAVRGATIRSLGQLIISEMKAHDGSAGRKLIIFSF